LLGIPAPEPEFTDTEVFMLVLSRRVGEAIVIDGGIRIKVAAVNGQTVRLAIEAPDATRIDRQEVYDRRQAAGFESPDQPLTAPCGKSDLLTYQL
jgi:carbon storage regulator